MRRLSFHLRVQREVNEAVRWYEDRQDGLGEAFFAQVQTSLIQLAEHAEGFSFWLGSNRIRRVKLKRFPYDVLFEVRSAEEVRVLCLRHEKRHPHFGLGRQ